VQIRQNAANEYFSGYGAGFSYGANSNTALPFFIGAELSGDFDLGDNAKFLPFLRISWVTDTASQATMNASYTASGGPSIYSNGTPSFGNAMIYKVGAKYNLGRTISAYGTLDVEQGNKTYNYRGIGGTIGLRYSF
jgi:outer membrane autotransporter protein